MGEFLFAMFVLGIVGIVHGNRSYIHSRLRAITSPTRNWPTTSAETHMISLRLSERFKPLLGTLLCVVLAAVVSIMGQGKPGKAALPMWFLTAVMVIIFRFGSLAGILGTIFSGIVSPRFSLSLSGVS